jgi:hypothetical protein
MKKIDERTVATPQSGAPQSVVDCSPYPHTPTPSLTHHIISTIPSHMHSLTDTLTHALTHAYTDSPYYL